MKRLFVLLMLVSCSQMPAKNTDEVPLDAALNQAQMSYLKGCVEAKKEHKVSNAFEGCRDKSLLHRQELDQILGQDL